MAKIAVFVEGQTESELVIRMLDMLCGKRGIRIELHEQFGGTLQLVAHAGSAAGQFFALVANCCNDGQVNSQIRDRYAKLIQQGYTHIIGIRDYYPKDRTKLARFQSEMIKHLPAGPIPVDLHLAIMEIEAWFLDETSHFERIDKSLTIDQIKASGFDVEARVGESWDRPAETLNSIYRIAGKAWNKSAKHVARTVDALCMDSLYVSARARSPSLDSFFSSLEAALFPPIAASRGAGAATN